MRQDDLAARLLIVFRGELVEQVHIMNAEVLALEKEPRDVEHLKSLFRVSHTLKGAARSAGVPLVEQVCHALESLLARVRDRALELAPEHFALLYAAADALSDAGRRLEASHSLDGSPLSVLHGILTGAVAQQGKTLPLPPAGMATSVAAQGSEGQVRVSVKKLDGLAATVEQLLVARRQIAVWTSDVQVLHDKATSRATLLRRNGRRARLVLERAATASTDAQGLPDPEESLRQLVRESEQLASSGMAIERTLGAATDRLARQVRQLRMRPFADACEALPRAVRDLAAASRKDVQFEILGAEVEADRAVLDGLRDALLHAVRNAVDHGIELPAVRQHCGKPRLGTVTVAAALREDRIVVTVTDDGAGLDVARIRAQMERQGLSIPVGDRDVARALFQGGLSTKTEATPISGRGVGLDAVRAALAELRGSVDVTWEEQRGTTLILECPPALATIRALLASVGSQTLAVPTTHVERLLRVAPSEVRSIEGRHVLFVAGVPVPLISLARILPPLDERPVSGPVSIVLLRAGGQRLAVAVDDLIAEEEIMLRPLSAGIPRLPHLSGAALLGTGRIALVLDVAALIATGLSHAAEGLIVAETIPAGAHKPRILVVDDSITTRLLEQSILEAAGYDVVTGVDGADGWRLLQERGADLVVADVEMPRMDGFGLCEAIRSSKRFKELPVVLLTALESPEHRQRGLAAGADAYVAKSSFDQESLLERIRQLLGRD